MAHCLWQHAGSPGFFQSLISFTCGEKAPTFSSYISEENLLAEGGDKISMQALSASLSSSHNWLKNSRLWLIYVDLEHSWDLNEPTQEGNNKNDSLVLCNLPEKCYVHQLWHNFHKTCVLLCRCICVTVNPIQQT